MNIDMGFDFELKTGDIHIKDLSAQDFDSLRIILLTLAQHSLTISKINMTDLSLQKLIAMADTDKETK